MSRLTKWIGDKKGICIEVCEKECTEGYYECHKCKPFADVLIKLAEYEDAEEQGLLQRLPVSIGSDVFYIPSKANFGLNVLHHHEEFNRVYHQKIARIHFTENGWYAEGNLNLEYGVVDRIFVDKLYKETWYLTKEEAEKALAELGNKNDC